MILNIIKTCQIICKLYRGCVPAAWNLSFRLTSREVGLMHQSGILDGRNMFQIMVSKDVLYPNESCLLQISFKPEFGVS